jgi:hypothetical protein
MLYTLGTAIYLSSPTICVWQNYTPIEWLGLIQAFFIIQWSAPHQPFGLAFQRFQRERTASNNKIKTMEAAPDPPGLGLFLGLQMYYMWDDWCPRRRPKFEVVYLMNGIIQWDFTLSSLAREVYFLLSVYQWADILSGRRENNSCSLVVSIIHDYGKEEDRVLLINICLCFVLVSVRMFAKLPHINVLNSHRLLQRQRQ